MYNWIRTRRIFQGFYVAENVERLLGTITVAGGV